MDKNNSVRSALFIRRPRKKKHVIPVAKINSNYCAIKMTWREDVQ